MYEEIQFSELQGKTLVSVTGKVGDEEMIFECDDGLKFKMLHHQDCCEGVAIEDIAGDLSDLLGSPILLAEEATSQEPEAFGGKVEPGDSQTWTFYKLRTNKGDVTIRWLGTSNGYYSESVSFERMD